MGTCDVQQRHSVDFDETHASVVNVSTLRLFFAVFASGYLECHQMYVQKMFWNEEREIYIFIGQSKRFVDEENLKFDCKLMIGS